MIRLLPVILFLLPSISVPGLAADFTSAQLDFFERKIRPVLSGKCYECHSATAEKLKSGLQVDHLEHLLRGGDSGPSIKVGDPENSFLIETISYHNPDLQMPPKEKLSDEVLADFKKWIGDGAAWPDEPVPTRGEEAHVEEFDLQKRFSEHWSWRPVEEPPVPEVKQKDWPDSPIDHFILRKIEDAGLRPAAPADDRTWLRRVHFDLNGLPPSLEGIDAFLNDRSKNRKEKVVDDLLASPRFGEKWARHWMDLVRYAETYGHEFDYPIDYAHEYRDYLIRAFNADVPFDQFAREHIAGDLLENPRLHPDEKFNESVLGTGFWYLHEATHAPTDILGDESDHHDNQIDVFAKSFLGLTVACARCHDHKFDAISTADYYALTGYLHSSARTELSMDPGNVRKEAAKKQLAILEELNQSPLPDFGSGTAKYFSRAAQLMRQQAEKNKAQDPTGTVVFEDFEKGFGKWEVSGKAFGKGPSTGAVGGQQSITGFVGKHFANSFTTGTDREEGELISKPFTISKSFIHFRIGGGSHETTALELRMNEEIVRTASGENRDSFRPNSWDVSELIGKEARLHLVDRHDSGWGHVLLDQIVFSDSSTAPVFGLPLPNTELIEKAARSGEMDPEILSNWCRIFTHDPSDPVSPFGFLASWVRDPDSVRGIQKQKELQHSRRQDFESTAKLFEDFNRATFPQGWSTSGEGFRMTGPKPAFSASEKYPLLRPGLISSRLLGEKHEGTLRSPSFTIDSDQILVKWRGEKALIRIVIDNYHMAKFNALLFRGTTHKNVSSDGKFKTLSIAGDLKKYRGHRAYLEFVDKGPGFIEIDEIRTFDSSAPADYLHPLVGTLAGNEDLASVEALAATLADEAKTNSVLQEWMAENGLVSFPDAGDRIAELRRLGRDLPPERFAVTMAEGTPENASVYIRGSHRTPGEEVPRRFLEALGAKEGDRLVLAGEVTSPDNPLTSRVIVNRIWHHFFGTGIVPSVDDFGPMGQLPSHPELLDWLASDFKTNGWSLKHTIRKIALSKTYAQSGKPNPEQDSELISSVDPTNALLHHMPVRRLQAEAIRDSILSVSGTLDETMYGKPVPTHRTAFMTGRGSRSSGPLDGAGRRSIYGSVYRNFLPPFQLAFDMPNPFGPKGRRSVSNVPAQALALMNDPFIIEQSRKWAQGNLEEFPDLTTDARIEMMTEKLTGQLPDGESRKRLNQFLDNQSKEYGALDERAWSDLAHALFNTKSFLYLN